ncbi:MAG: EF-P lysine aminoacylase GenX [Chlamydiales bacterium]|nr:EF-P lysine aminoacylase GenX [Chlamydiales bacterium]
MSLALTNRLEERAHMLARARAFFAEREVLEVDTPMLSRTAPIDAHIDCVEVKCIGKPAYLHTSPEYGMKRLLCEGSGDIYQLAHVFRDNEWGEKHTVEFTMAEWYRLGFSLQQMIEETFRFIQLFVEVDTFEVLSYHQVMCGHDEESFALNIEPTLGQGKVTFMTDYPPEKAMLAQVNAQGVAERFEVFYQGIELANGYHELGNALEQRRRLQEANRERLEFGKSRYPLDTLFLEALEKGLPDCCGVAVGFDRLMMLRYNAGKIDNILPFRSL